MVNWWFEVYICFDSSMNILNDKKWQNAIVSKDFKILLRKEWESQREFIYLKR